MRKLLFALLCGVLLQGIGGAVAETYPSHPVTLVVPFAAGGPVDTLARFVTARMQNILGQNFIIENVTGAGGSIGVGRVAHAAPDGYTLVEGIWSTAVVNGAIYKLNYDVFNDFEPIALLTNGSQLIVIKKDNPANNLKEFLELAKKEPGKFTYGTAGNGSANHLAGEMLKSMAKVDITHVPYKGGAPAIVALLGGEISTVVAFPLAALPHVKAGKLKALAVTGKKRSKALPDVPTVAESGVGGYEFSSWMGLTVPKGTPDAVIQRIHVAASAALKEKEVVEKLLAGMTEPVAAGPKEFGELIQREGDRWSRLIKQYGMKID